MVRAPVSAGTSGQAATDPPGKAPRRIGSLLSGCGIMVALCFCLVMAALIATAVAAIRSI
jgi:hypothetical protein